MTKDQAKELIPIMQAWVDGKVIQYRDRMRNDVGWTESTPYPTLEFNPHLFEYRIKPEPQHIWRVSYEFGDTYDYSSKEPAMKRMQNSGHKLKLTHFVEVTGE
jgi:hypothetical protein